MDTLLTGNVWRQVATKANAAKRRLAAVAYVHNDGHLKLRRNDVLICDASDRAIRAGETSARLLETLYRRSVEIRSRRDLHAKVAVFGRFALIGSMNLSGSAANILTELALFTDRKQIVSQATAFVHQIRENSQKVNNQFLRRILGIKVRRTPRYRGRYKAPPRLGDRAWFVSAREVSDESFPDESGLVEKAEKKATLLLADKDATISWIRLIGRSRVRSHARPGDIFVQILESESGKRVSVYEPVSIVLRQDVAHWTRFYIAESDNRSRISWKQFRKRAKEHGFARISQNSLRELNSREMLLLEGFWK